MGRVLVFSAYVLNGFNYDRGQNVGLELKGVYTNGNFKAYTNWAWARQIATNIVSNQYLFSPDELAYIATHYIYTDHAQVLTGSAGMSYLWMGTKVSADMIYGSGLRSGFANTDHLPPYAQVMQFDCGGVEEFPDLDCLLVQLLNRLGGGAHACENFHGRTHAPLGEQDFDGFGQPHRPLSYAGDGVTISQAAR